MTYFLVADEVMDVVFELFHIRNLSQIEEWKIDSPIELGVLSWHLGNFYCCPFAEAVPIPSGEVSRKLGIAA